MSYQLKIFAAEEVTDGEREQAGLRFRKALEETLGDAALVAPVYRAYLKLLQVHADHPRPWPVSPEELLLAETWEAAELAATEAAFGSNRYMGDAHFELIV
jgi:non-ribosomal peptide synthetase component F